MRVHRWTRQARHFGVADTGWKTKRLNRIAMHGECGSGCSGERDGLDTRSVSKINLLCERGGWANLNSPISGIPA